MPILSYGESIRSALASEMRLDERVYVFGEDMAGYGGVFGVTQKLLEEFGNTRVRNTPLSEAAIMGEAIGAALAGLRPVPEIQFSDFMTTAFSQIIDAAASYHYRFNTSLPLTLRAPHGGGMRIGNFHSKCPEAYYFHTPGLKIVCPSTPYEAKGLLIAAIRDPDPVIYFEEKKLYWEIKGEVPEEAYELPLGKADLKREGKDITLVTYGSMVHLALKAAQVLEKEKIELEVLDLRSLTPLDEAALFQSFKKTNRVIVLHEAVQRGGIGGELVSLIVEKCFDDLAAPPLRIASKFCPVPVAPTLEDAYLPSLQDILEGARGLMRY
ncbi:MAG: alpha-ketoacid dehydrogenase subunit beta [Deltaproteobacteria bacterium]|nr:alpha-ketoacid dehydrogenase subunit beta [Deltaproteobacteria bacterium]